MQANSLTLDQILDEPIVRLMMAADRVDERDLRATMTRACEAAFGLQSEDLTADCRPSVRLLLTGEA
ncbi:hypothetical protein D3273_14515 [Lichenibacterium minor]|uniref:Uncharacterized protein n=1 Tax=Lichenibacterium minor TaxID=2316528 RepID=A0A4Q2U8V3_9HYPH|nr:hypothetical protein [Lichenibacterium minor]RYC31325.1 hypothetical protein D3273_14515 [Lichenibacterium minor]